MTDDQIRAWLEFTAAPLPQDVQDCLTELLAHRELHRAIKYAVWVRDQSAESGWTCWGWFPDKDLADEYANETNLVLPFGEVPCLTAR